MGQGWGIPGNIGAMAAGAAEALTQLREEGRREIELQSLLQSREFQQWLQQEQLREQQAARAAAAAERAESRKVDQARTVLDVQDSLFDPTTIAPMEIDGAQRAQLRGTPYDARVKDETTLPARATVPELGATIDPQPQEYSYLRPTTAQQQQRRTVQLFNRQQAERQQLAKDPTTPERVRQLAGLVDAGFDVAPLGPTALETPEDRLAADEREFRNFTRRENYQDSLIRGRQAAGRAPAVTQQDRIDARREARRDAIAEYNARKDPMTGMGTVDLDELIEQYETEYLGLLEALEAPEAPAPSAGANGAASPATTRTPIRRLTPMTPPVSDGKPVIRRPNGVRVLQPGELQRRPQGTSPAAGSDLPRLRERRIIAGQLAEWDGQGWLPVRQ